MSKIIPRLVAALFLLQVLPHAAWASTLQLTVVDKNGDPLANAAVILDDRDLPAAAQNRPQSVIVDQVNRQFTPFMTAMKVGSEVVFPNSDNIRHHVYSFSDPKPFELKLYAGEDRPSVVFNRPGVVTLGCNIHDQMIAHLLITDGQTAMLSDADGKVSVELADDTGDSVTFRVWHPWQGQQLAQAKTLTVTADKAGNQRRVELQVAPPERKQEPKSRLQQRFDRTGNL